MRRSNSTTSFSIINNFEEIQQCENNIIMFGQIGHGKTTLLNKACDTYFKTAESGFNLPNQISVANSEAFLQTDKKPNNSIIFVEAANYQTKGDWAYLPDKLWIDDWARDLNSKVLDGTMSIDEFFAKHQAPTDAKLRNY